MRGTIELGQTMSLSLQYSSFLLLSTLVYEVFSALMSFLSVRFDVILHFTPLLSLYNARLHVAFSFDVVSMSSYTSHKFVFSLTEDNFIQFLFRYW